MEIEDVNVIGVEAAQRIFDGLDHPFARMAAKVRALGVGIDEFRGQNPVIARGLDAAPDDFFRLAVVIDIGGVDEIDALFASLVDDADTSSGVGPPNIIVPRLSGETFSALRPR